MKKYVGLVMIAASLSCANHKPDDKASISVPVEHIEPTQAQKERRAQSEAYCKAHGIPVYSNPNAMFMDDDSQVTLRTQDELADRALALCFIGLKSEGLEQSKLDLFNEKYNLEGKLSPAELAYVNTKHPTEQQKIDANWRYEDLHVMLWALGYIDQLAYPDQMCNVAQDVKIISDLTEDEFKAKAKLRSKKEILDQADLILRLDWACVDARTKNQPAPGKMDKGVVYERHYALNWLIKLADQHWDEVSTDT
ncbi:DUF4272 domain-containing protein [Mucilaginibacter galii]|uniref:DUF4272 domain-containing protein n=1 Tax=Mucilaginibacter galii TaxID=2005073 RepID=A0A917J626_9SPHI|nr:DUF4272 domain-containing protein [Mucilaginibacter galii]GGI49186.1 hypothetical protein GCM10011425_03980 [Mucilaginibacter galii]